MEVRRSFLWVQLKSADIDPLTFWFQQQVAGQVHVVNVPHALLGAMVPEALAAYVTDCYLEEHPAERERVGHNKILRAVVRALPKPLAKVLPRA